MSTAQNVWILLERADDLPGVWISHCLDFDVMSQGHNLEDALSMIVEAVGLALDHNRVTPPRAPDDAWERLYGVLRHGRPVELAALVHDESRLVRVAAQLELQTHQGRPQVPVAWAA